jgi:hypothetical protein
MAAIVQVILIISILLITVFTDDYNRFFARRLLLRCRLATTLHTTQTPTGQCRSRHDGRNTETDPE